MKVRRAMGPSALRELQTDAHFCRVSEMRQIDVSSLHIKGVLVSFECWCYFEEVETVGMNYMHI